MTELTTDAVSLLSEMIEIESFSRNELALADFLQHYMELRGYVVMRKANNLWLMSPSFDTARPTILLNSHIDTVKPASGWQRNPLQANLENGLLYGLGSNDAGASVVSLMQVFFYLTQRQQAYNLIFAATAEEEVSGSNGIESLLAELPAIHFAVVGEPTQMQVAVAEKGLMVLDCIAYGKAGHAARNEGYNAIYKALADIAWFQQYHFPKVSSLLGEVKMSVTQIQAGTQHNVVPAQCSFVVDIRSNEMYSNDEILSEIKSHLGCHVTARSTRLSSTATPLDHAFVKRALELNLSLYGSPTLSDQALMPFPSVKIGPGNSARSHTADEYIATSEIEEGIALYIQLLDGLVL
ncbi:MAG: acetylornithine deacetylase [Porphyromonadaceae bacterium CG2_30_38_12]|nr:MAG: acetylornithine deacetylase [Porphyromonadaceae bacterium CG2_30_38_12]